MKRHAPEEPEDDAPLFAACDVVKTTRYAPMVVNLASLSPPHNRTPTSVAAATSKVSDAATERARVYAYIASLGAVGATREEIEDALQMPGNTVRPRVWELMGNGGHVARIREAGFTRATRSGRRAEVLVII